MINYYRYFTKRTYFFKIFSKLLSITNINFGYFIVVTNFFNIILILPLGVFAEKVQSLFIPRRSFIDLDDVVNSNLYFSFGRANLKQARAAKAPS